MASLLLAPENEGDIFEAARAAQPSEEPEAEAPKTPPPKKKRGTGMRKSGKKGPNPERRLPDSKKCTDCKKEKPMSEYYADQNRCKTCFSDGKALMRTAESQGVKQQVIDLRDKDPPAFAELQRSFNKSREEARKSAKKMKFNIGTFIKEYEKKMGFRDSRLGEMMWQKEFEEFAATAKMGFLTKEEADLTWKEMQKDSWRPRDHRGPRGYFRMWIKTKDVGELYNDVNAGFRYQVEEQMKKPSEEQMKSRIAAVYGDTLQDEEMLDFNVVAMEARRAAGSGQRMEGLLQEELLPMMESAERKAASKGKGKSALQKGQGEQDDEDESEDGSDDSEDAEGDDDEEPGEAGQAEPSAKRRKTAAGKSKAAPKAGNKKASWYDAETKNLKAEKDYVRGIDVLCGSLSSLSAEMTAAVTQFRAQPQDAQAAVGCCVAVASRHVYICVDQLR